MKRRTATSRDAHRRARLPRGGFTPARALRQWYMVQSEPLTISDLRKELGQRGHQMFGIFDRRPLETLDREDLLRPIGYGLHGAAWRHDLQGWLGAGALLLRDETGYRPWAELDRIAERRYGAELSVLYHRWQLIWLCDLFDMLSVRSPLNFLSEGLEAYFTERGQRAAAPQSVPRGFLFDEAHAARRTELLLLRVQNIFLPRVLGGHYQAGSQLGLAEDVADWTRDRQRRFNAAAEARAVRTSPEELAAIVDQLSSRGQRLDPNRDLFVLLDGVKRSRIERLRGDARRAWDFYDAARILASWHRELTGERLPDVDEPFDMTGGDYKLRLYGSRRPGKDRSALPALLDDFGLYPYRVELMGEGESELAALEEILEYGYGLEFARLGILTTDLGGADVPTAARRMLSSLRRYANYFLLVLDNENTAREMVDELLRSKVIEGIPDERRRAAVRDALAAVKAQTFETDEQRKVALRGALRRGTELDQEPGEAPEHVLWKDNLEADNFTTDELVRVVARQASDANVEAFELTAEDLHRALDEADERRGVASVLVDLAADRHLVIGKPELVRALARYAVDQPELDGRRRPILDLAEHLVRLTMADRQLRGQLRTR